MISTGLTRTACAAAAVGIAVIAALMFIRMQAEALIALGPAGWVTALVIALVVAVVSVLANFLVVAIHALDGSDQAARLEAMSAATGGPLSRVYQMQEKADLILHRIAVHQRRAARAAVRAGTEAGRYPADADEVIEAVNAWAREAYDWPAGYRAASLAGLRRPRETLEHFDTALPDAPPTNPSNGRGPESHQPRLSGMIMTVRGLHFNGATQVSALPRSRAAEPNPGLTCGFCSVSRRYTPAQWRAQMTVISVHGVRNLGSAVELVTRRITGSMPVPGATIRAMPGHA